MRKNDTTSDRDEALSVLSDVFKEINGWRPRDLYDTENMTADDVWKEVARLQDEQKARKARKAAEAAATEAVLTEAAKPLTHNPFAALLGNKDS